MKNNYMNYDGGETPKEVRTARFLLQLSNLSKHTNTLKDLYRHLCDTGRGSLSPMGSNPETCLARQNRKQFLDKIISYVLFIEKWFLRNFRWYTLSLFCDDLYVLVT